MATGQKGQDLILSITPTGGGSKTPVGYMQSKELSRSADTVDTSNDDEPDWATSLLTQRSWGINGSALYVYDDPGQEAVEEAYENDDPATFHLEPRNPDGSDYKFEGQGHLTDASISAETNEAIEYSLEVEGTGPVTRTQTTV
jgi:TP901-1 family phage major tail protein